MTQTCCTFSVNYHLWLIRVDSDSFFCPTGKIPNKVSFESELNQRPKDFSKFPAVTRREAGTRARRITYTIRSRHGVVKSLHISGLLGNIGLPKEKPCKLYFSLNSIRQKLVTMIDASVRTISSICFPFSDLSAFPYLQMNRVVPKVVPLVLVQKRNRQPINSVDLNYSKL